MNAYFETVSFSNEDVRRSDYYRDNALRDRFQKNFTDLKEYLQNLRMEATVGRLDDFTLPRVVQLINKSNQFNLTTIRYSEGEVRALMTDPLKCCLHFTLKDHFGDNGLISVVILHKTGKEAMLIDSWVMSCRVLSRGMEEFICREIVDLARQQGCCRLTGKYIPTKKNRLVERLYERLHFTLTGDAAGTTTWELDLQGTVTGYATFIERRSSEQFAIA
jgi:FkbH-like protein